MSGVSHSLADVCFQEIRWSNLVITMDVCLTCSCYGYIGAEFHFVVRAHIFNEIP